MKDDLIFITSTNEMMVTPSRGDRIFTAARRAKAIEDAKKQLALGNYIS